MQTVGIITESVNSDCQKFNKDKKRETATTPFIADQRKLTFQLPITDIPMRSTYMYIRSESIF